MPKNVKGGSLGVHNKVSQSQIKPAQKMFGHGRDSNPRPSAWQTSKILKKLDAEATLV